MPSDVAANTTSAVSMQLRLSGVRCEPSVMPTPTQTRLPVGLLCIRLYFGPCRGERGQRFQVRADRDERRERREIGLEAARVEHLRHEVHVGERDRIAEAIAAGGGVL